MPESIRTFNGLTSAFQRREPITWHASSLPFALSYSNAWDTVALSREGQEIAQLDYSRIYERFKKLWAVHVVMDGDLYRLNRDGISHTEQFDGTYPQLTHFWLSGEQIYWSDVEKNNENKGKLSSLEVVLGERDRDSKKLAITYNLRPGRYRHTVTLYDRTTDRRRPKVIAAEAPLFDAYPANLSEHPNIAGRTRYEIEYDTLAARIIETAQLPEVLSYLPTVKSTRKR